ncbi:MAG TPA: trypsin-like peptidase domain-containing protein, partial [Polyangiaceae bacterium]
MFRKSLCLIALAAGACHAEVAPALGDRPTLALLGESGITCGAVAVAPSLAVTANHCARTDIVEYVAPTRQGEQRRGLGVIVWREAASDLAAFAAEGLVPAELAEGPLDAEHVTTLVTHIPEPWSVVKVRLGEFEHGFLRTDRLRAGMSGSGLWDDGGRLVGVAVGNDEKRGYFAG